MIDWHRLFGPVHFNRLNWAGAARIVARFRLSPARLVHRFA
jgi:hypothetical protein